MDKKPSAIRGKAIRTLLVDDSRIITDILESFLADTGRIDVVGVATDGREAIAKTRTLRPELVVMDINMPNVNGLRASAIIKAEHPEARIVLLTLKADEAHRRAARKVGVDGFCDKLRMEEELPDAIRSLFPDRMPSP